VIAFFEKVFFHDYFIFAFFVYRSSIGGYPAAISDRWVHRRLRFSLWKDWERVAVIEPILQIETHDRIAD
jgi:hypothetical protein